MDYWIVYDEATGSVLWRGEGSSGVGAYQQVPEGAALVVVPRQVIAKPEIDMDALRGTMALRIDAEAEAVRQRFLTPGAGQAMTYQRKEAEARAWTADDAAATPFLSAEAAARGMTIADLSAEVTQLADVWTAIGSAIEGKRMGAKAAVASATTLGAIVAAARIDWGAIVAPTA